MSKRYDHRLRNAIVKARNPDLFPELEIPRSTARDWIRKGPANIVSLDEFDMKCEELVTEIEELKQNLAKAEAKANLVTSSITILGFQLQYVRVPSAESKTSLIEAIQAAAKTMGLTDSLETIQLSRARFSAWVARRKKCRLDDRDTCGRLSPMRLLAEEVAKIKELVLNPEHRHFSLKSLAIWAKRQELVHASSSSWHRVIQKYNLIRPGKRVYPPKPKVGIRASAPGQILHLDQTVIKLQDQRRCFIQALVDNFSRYILAWHVSLEYGGNYTADLLSKGIRKLGDFGIGNTPQVLVDGGSENHNEPVTTLVSQGQFKLLTAQIEIDYSNSMIESVFNRLKNWHLYLQQLTSIEKLVEHTDFYLTEANETIPLQVLRGATPLEVISGGWDEGKIEKLKDQAASARKHRLEINRARICGSC